jgi:hypothetical protein
MEVEVLFRLAVTAVLIVTPTLLFLGFWRGLHAMQDDDLVMRVQWRMMEEGTWTPTEKRSPLTRADLDPDLDAAIASRTPVRPHEE